MKVHATQGAKLPKKKRRQAVKPRSTGERTKKYLSDATSIMPVGRVTADRIPIGCMMCKWDYDTINHVFVLKYFSNACPLRRNHVQ